VAIALDCIAILMAIAIGYKVMIYVYDVLAGLRQFWPFRNGLGMLYLAGFF
jgi:hypothetical protein